MLPLAISQSSGCVFQGSRIRYDLWPFAYTIFAPHDAYDTLGRGFGAHRKPSGSRCSPSRFHQNTASQLHDAHIYGTIRH